MKKLSLDEQAAYNTARKCIEDLALYLRPFTNGNITSLLSRPMQRKLVTLINCQLVEEEGRSRALRAARSLGERTVTELILQHQNPQQLSTNLWAAVRARGCQFLGPAMQEEVLKLVLLALEDGSALSRKVLVMFVVQRLEPHFPQASKTSIGHVVQLLYRASCFKVSKREGDSSLMQLKEEFRTYEALRREHDAQIVQIATEAGLRIAPDQWSALLYGDTNHKSHMQSIMDKLQTPQSFAQSVQELVIALQRTNDPANLAGLRAHLNKLTNIDPTTENSSPSMAEVATVLEAVKKVVIGLVDFVQHHGNRKLQDNSFATHNNKYKISMCRDLSMRGICPRGTSCTFAHSEDELEKYRAKNRKMHTRTPIISSDGGIGTMASGTNDVNDYLIDNNYNSTHSYLSSSNEDMSPQRFNARGKSPKLPLKNSLSSPVSGVTGTTGAGITQHTHDRNLFLKTSPSLMPGMNMKSPKNSPLSSHSTLNLLHAGYESTPPPPVHLARRSFESPAKNSYSMQSGPSPLPPHQYPNQMNRSQMDYRNSRFMTSPKFPMPPNHPMHNAAAAAASGYPPPPPSAYGHSHMMNKFNGPNIMPRSPQHTSPQLSMQNHPNVGGVHMSKKFDAHVRPIDDNIYAGSIWDHHVPHKSSMSSIYQSPQQQLSSHPPQAVHQTPSTPTNQYKVKSPYAQSLYRQQMPSFIGHDDLMKDINRILVPNGGNGNIDNKVIDATNNSNISSNHSNDTNNNVNNGNNETNSDENKDFYHRHHHHHHQHHHHSAQQQQQHQHQTKPPQTNQLSPSAMDQFKMKYSYNVSQFGYINDDDIMKDINRILIQNGDKGETRSGNGNGNGTGNSNASRNNDTNNNVDANVDKDDMRFGNSATNSILNHGVFIRSDSILTDDDFVPFDSPSQSKCGPISRKSTSMATTASTKTSPNWNQQKDNSKHFPCVDSFCADLTAFGGGNQSNALDSNTIMSSPSTSSSLWQFNNLRKQNPVSYSSAGLLPIKPIQQITHTPNDSIGSILSSNIFANGKSFVSQCNFEN